MRVKKVVSLLLTFTIAAGLLAGCGDGKKGEDKNSKSTKSNNTDTKGRYIENDIPLPDDSGDPIGMIWKDGKLVVYTGVFGDAPKYQSYTYEGGAWSQPNEENWLLDGLQRLHLKSNDIRLGQDGSLYSIANCETEEIPYGDHILKASEDGQSAEDVTPEPLLKVNESGYTERLLDLEILNDGAFVAACFSNDSIDFYRDGKKITGIEGTSAVTERQEMAGVSDKTIAAISADGKGIDFYDSTNYEKTGSIDLDQSQISAASARLVSGPDGIWYVANDMGIHRIKEDGSIVETLMDGANGLMGTDRAELLSFLTGEQDVFYGLYSDNGTRRLKQYAFDQSVPAVQSNTLNIYSLKENATVNQAVYEFQNSHPDVKVDYKFAVGTYESPSTDDIRNLNAELLNGGGADVLILDGLPLDSYMDKGILTDISDLTDKLSESGVLLDVIGNTAQKDGKIYGLPARIGVPIVYGTDEEMNATQNLDALSQYAQQHPDQRLFGKTTHSRLGISLFATMYDEIIQEDGVVDQEKLSQFLNAWMQICENSGTKSFEEALGEEDTYWKQSGINFISDYNIFGDKFASIEEFRGLNSMTIAFERMKQGNYPYTSVKQLYVPCTIAGINASSGNQELAGEFIENLFSDPVQQLDAMDGFPVTEKGLTYLAEYVESDAAAEYYVGSGGEDPETGERYEIGGGYPERSVVEEFITLIKGLETPFLSDQVLMNTVMEEMENCYAGTQTQEETAKAIGQKVDTYLSE